jgi:hypothetical protein
MNNETRLQQIETRIAMLVCSIHGIVTKAEIDLRDALRAKLGKRWDAINLRWEDLEEEVA